MTLVALKKLFLVEYPNPFMEDHAP